MLTLIGSYYTTIVSLLIVSTLAFLGYVFLIREQAPRLNWAIFYSTLYVGITLPIINYICVQYDFWHFSEQGINSLLLPFDIYFLWVVAWGVTPVFFLKGRYLVPLAIFIFWIDILVMPWLERFGIISLGEYWLIGELVLIGSVFVPAYYWALCSHDKKRHGFRASLQVVVMGSFFIVGLPFILESYGMLESVKLYKAPFTFQLFLIIVFPSLIAVIDLVEKGKGTPFPYDPTKYLVRTGVYAYCRNPIQWSFTLMFIPLAIYYSSFYLLAGSIVSIAYVFGVSDFQEDDDMRKRFGNEWKEYRKNVSKWIFLWKPKAIPNGQIFFNASCTQCDQISKWFIDSKAINLDVRSSVEFSGNTILQVTYVDHNGLAFKSVEAIACSLEHINLGYATLGWLMRFPLINYVLQAIVDTMEFGGREEDCEVEEIGRE